jgi:phage terminase large subunit-like protein
MLTALIMNRRPEAELTLIAPTKDVADRAFGHADGSIRLDPHLTTLVPLPGTHQEHHE